MKIIRKSVYSRYEQLNKVEEILKRDNVTDEVAYIVYKTNDYAKFKKFGGNRHTRDKNIVKIEQSYMALGDRYIDIPIIVNEHFEVIDGQHRFDFCFDKKLPIVYQIIPGLGYREMIALNEGKTNWNREDTIDFYADGMSSPDFKRLQDLYDKYPNVAKAVICVAVHGNNNFSSRDFRNGTLCITKEQYDNAIDVLDYVNDFVTKIKSKKMKRANLSMAETIIAKCYHFEGIDREKLVDRVVDGYNSRGGWNNLDTCAKIIDDIYNYKLREANRVDIYKKYLESIDTKIAKPIPHNKSIFDDANVKNPFEHNYSMKKQTYEKFIG